MAYQKRCADPTSSGVSGACTHRSAAIIATLSRINRSFTAAGSADPRACATAACAPIDLGFGRARLGFGKRYAGLSAYVSLLSLLAVRVAI